MKSCQYHECYPSSIMELMVVRDTIPGSSIGGGIESEG